jgi:hypothetical protein
MARMTNDVSSLLIFLNSSSLQMVADSVLAVGIVVGLLFISSPGRFFIRIGNRFAVFIP